MLQYDLNDICKASNVVSSVSFGRKIGSLEDRMVRFVTVLRTISIDFFINEVLEKHN